MRRFRPSLGCLCGQNACVSLQTMAAIPAIVSFRGRSSGCYGKPGSLYGNRSNRVQLESAGRSAGGQSPVGLAAYHQTPLVVIDGHRLLPKFGWLQVAAVPLLPTAAIAEALSCRFCTSALPGPSLPINDFELVCGVLHSGAAVPIGRHPCQKSSKSCCFRERTSAHAGEGEEQN